MHLEKIVDPWKKKPYLFSSDNSFDWKGTIGVGDILFGLNIAHMCDHLVRKTRDVSHTTMNVHWTHDHDYLHHFEDPETIIERTNYLHSLFYNNEHVKINHICLSNDREIQMLRYRGVQPVSNPMKVIEGLQSWIFRRELWCDNPVENKVVFWRTLFNANQPYAWKRSFKAHHWEKIIRTLESKGFNLVELTYRTPVREAFYHINTSRFCIFYDGMWQYIARNLCKPVIALGDSNILPIHNPQGVLFKTPTVDKNGSSLFTYLNSIERNLSHLDRRANRYREMIMRELNVTY
jgi:hypothetical protein